MKRRNELLSTLFVSVCCFCSNAFAWSATANGDPGYLFTQIDASSAASANELALTGCSKNHTGCELLGPAVHGTAIAITSNRAGTYLYRATDPDPLVAAENARKQCKKKYPDCYLRGVYWDEGKYWYSVATSDYYVQSFAATTDHEAKEGALRNCAVESAKRSEKQAECKTLVTGFGPVWVAIAQGSLGRGTGTSGKREKAESLALETCSEFPENKSCVITSTLEPTYRATPAPASFKTLEATVIRERVSPKIANVSPSSRLKDSDCRPKASSIRCQSKCMNGDCIVTYENGCKVRVNVAPKLDPFTSQWTYPSPEC